MTRALRALLAVAGFGLAGCAGPAAGQGVSPPTVPTAPMSSLVAPPTTTVPPSTPSTPVVSVPRPVPGPVGGRWVPRPGTAWQWQLTNPIDQSVDVPVYDVDSTNTTVAEVQSLHAKGRRVICYVNTGADENFRSDAQAFPAAVLGNPDGWPGERWLDVRQLDVLRPIIASRFDLCRGKGFDGIEADLVDGYQNDTGFPLTADDQLRYNRLLAALAHQRGLSIGLKNDLDQVPQLAADFDFAVNEQCFQYQECDQLLPFIRAGKAVFQVEYKLDNSQFCTRAVAMGFSSMRKNPVLDAPRWPCS